MDKFLLGGGVAALALGALTRTVTYYDDSFGEEGGGAPYSEFASNVMTGDVLLCSSTKLDSFTRAVTGSLWSHVGIAYVDDLGRVFEWSSHNPSENIDNSLGVVCGGAQLVPLGSLVSSCGSIFWKTVELTDRQREHVYATVKQLAYKLRYSDNIELLSFTGLPLQGYGGGMACSHLIASTYASADALELDRDLATYMPHDFSDTGNAKWTVTTGRTRMVIGYDASNLIRLPSLHKK